MSLLITTTSATLEVIEKSKEFIVSNENELKEQLRLLNVNLGEVINIDTNKPVTEWDNVMGVFKKGEIIFAHSKSIGSEIEANLKIFA